MDYSVLSREDPTHQLIEPDVVTPEQFIDMLSGSARQSGERRLFAAVLIEAVETFHKNAFADLPDTRAAFREVREWLDHHDDPGLFAYETVCGVLGIDPTYLREGLHRWLDENRAGQPRISARFLGDQRRRLHRAA